MSGLRWLFLLLLVFPLSAEATVTRDRVPPKAPSIIGPHVTTATRPVFRFSSSDRVTSRAKLRYRCSFDTVRLHGCARRYVQALGAGHHLLRARAMDKAGNVSRLTRFHVQVLAPPPPPPPPPPPGPFALQISTQGSGAVQLDNPPGARCSGSCSYSYTTGTTVTLTADAVEGSFLAGWGGDCAGTSYTCVVVMDRDRTVSAVFEPYSWNLTVTVNGPGTVDSGDGRIHCGAVCSASYGFGAYVTLTATPDAGHVFMAWGGGCASQGNPCNVGMFGPTSVDATFG
jgi:hypothetical protein